MQVGELVQNRGLCQQWIGRVVAINGASLLVRITWASRRYSPGDQVWFVVDETKSLTHLSLAAAFRQWWS